MFLGIKNAQNGGLLAAKSILLGWGIANATALFSYSSKKTLVSVTQ